MVSLKLDSWVVAASVGAFPVGALGRGLQAVIPLVAVAGPVGASLVGALEGGLQAVVPPVLVVVVLADKM